MKKKHRQIFFLTIAIMMLLTACHTDQNNIPSAEQGNTISTESTESTEQDIAKEETLDLYGTYDENDLLITTLEEEYNGKRVQIPQIEGLKDTAVQEKINKEMRNRIETRYQEIPTMKEVTFDTLSNFSNVISLVVYIEKDEYSFDWLYLNYNLVDGEQIQFEDLFTKDTDTLTIIREGFRETLVRDAMAADYDEAMLFKLVKTYSKAKEKKFGFSPSSISLYTKDTIAYIPIESIADEVTIYSKYKTDESLFTRDDIGRKGLFSCMDVQEDLFDKWEYGLGTDNLWYDLTLSKLFLYDETSPEKIEKCEIFKQHLAEELQKRLDEYLEIAKANPDNFYVALVKGYVYIEGEYVMIDDVETYIESDIAEVTIYSQLLQMPQKTYDTVYKNKIIDSYRTEYFVLQGGLILDVTESDVTVTDKQERMRYNYMTSEKIEDIKED